MKPFRRSDTDASESEATRPAATSPTRTIEPVPIADNDPLVAYLLGVGGPVDVDRVELDSPALEAMRASGVAIVVPLISQGELIGTLNLGRRMSDQPYSTDDRKLLRGLAGQVAPAIRLAQLVREQEAEAKERERIEQELRVAALIQQTLLPKEVPALPGWEIDAHYRPARAVGGDFYDFLPMSRGRLGIVIGDVTDKGVPAALVMATTRSTLRAAAQRSDDPGTILADANETLVVEVPQGMFVTCLFAILEPSSGRLTFANAGHNLPYVRTEEGVVELRATGMPLGLMSDMEYDVSSTTLPSGSVMLLTSDGIVEAHSPDGDMFGFGRLMGLVGSTTKSSPLISAVLLELDRFCGADHEQEDDVTMVAVRRVIPASDSADAFDDMLEEIDNFTVASQEGNERAAMERVTAAAAAIGISGAALDRLGTAVAEATMNAIEHGHGFDETQDVEIGVLQAPGRFVVRIVDRGAGPDLPNETVPDLDAKLAGEQSPRGWGLFLIEQMVDEFRHHQVGERHVIELEMKLEGAAR